MGGRSLEQLCQRARLEPRLVDALVRALNGAQDVDVSFLDHPEAVGIFGPPVRALNPKAVAEATRGHEYVIFDEPVDYAASYAFERLTGDADVFYEAWERYGAGEDDDAAAESDMREDFDFDNADEMHRHLPRLAARYLGAAVSG